MEYVLITGGTSGIGYELARCFAQHDKNLIIVSSNSERLAQTKIALEKEYNISVKIYEQDLAKAGSASDLYNKIKAEKLAVSILVNNAGFGLVGGTENIDFNLDEKLLTLNIISLVELSKHFITDMYQKGHGKILNVASTGAFQPGPYTSTYFASKAFVLNYSQAIRYEARHKNVQVCTVCPGSTRTEFFAKEGVATPKHAMTAEAVAMYTYKKFMRNKAIIIPGLINKILRILPQGFKMKMVAGMKNPERKNH